MGTMDSEKAGHLVQGQNSIRKCRPVPVYCCHEAGSRTGYFYGLKVPVLKFVAGCLFAAAGETHHCARRGTKE